jgi:hypothetical protein
MTLAASIKTDPLLFDKLLEPLQHPLAELAQQPLSQAAFSSGWYNQVRHSKG